MGVESVELSTHHGIERISTSFEPEIDHNNEI
jgi:hypothetical protein